MAATVDFQVSILNCDVSMDLFRVFEPKQAMLPGERSELITRHLSNRSTELKASIISKWGHSHHHLLVLSHVPGARKGTNHFGGGCEGNGRTAEFTTQPAGLTIRGFLQGSQHLKDGEGGCRVRNLCCNERVVWRCNSQAFHLMMCSSALWLSYRLSCRTWLRQTWQGRLATDGRSVISPQVSG